MLSVNMEMYVLSDLCKNCPAGKKYAVFSALEDELNVDERKNFLNLTSNEQNARNPRYAKALREWSQTVLDNKLRVCPCNNNLANLLNQ